MTYINPRSRLGNSFILKQFHQIKMKFLFPILIALNIFEIGSTGVAPTTFKNKRFYLNSKQLIRKFGYPSESHTIQTADGYLLEIHRIPHGKSLNTSSKGEKPPIFLLHGLFGSSEIFFIRESAEDLPFLLADSGFDVWLGNIRGNKYSRAHVTLFPEDKRFWNFTWHESAVYDVPAQIDFICNYTKQEKIIFIGTSLGATIFFAMTSTLPEYNKKIELSLLMAAVAYVGNIKSSLLRHLTPLSEGIKVLADVMVNGAFLQGTNLLKGFGKIFCDITTLGRKLCRNAMFLIVGSDQEEFDENLVASLINHYPAGYSAKGVNHYSQLVKSGKFRQYDYGRKGNLLEYGSPTPPDYNLSLITTPIYMYEGKNDYLSDPKDVNRLAKELKSLRKIRVVDYPKFTHLDFIVSLNAKELVYDMLIGDLMSHLNENKKIH